METRSPIRSMFSRTRRDFSAPKISSPRTIVLRKVFSPRPCRTARSISLSRIAITTLVSRRYLPLTGLDPFATLLNGFAHLPRRFLVQRAAHAEKVLHGSTLHPGRIKAAHEF